MTENGKDKFEIDSCPLCGRKTTERKLWAHHITYEPEKIIYVCRQCHSVIHWINRIGMDALNQIISWSLLHGKSWENGNKKYQASEHKKKVNAKWAKENKERRNETQRRLYQLHPERHRDYVRQYRARLKERRLANG